MEDVLERQPERECLDYPVEDRDLVKDHEFYLGFEIANASCDVKRFKAVMVNSIPRHYKSTLPFFCMEVGDVFDNKIYLLSLVFPKDTEKECLHLFADYQATMVAMKKIPDQGIPNIR